MSNSQKESADLSILSYPVDGKGRIKYGSKKEFQSKFLLDNWGMSNSLVASVFGCTSGWVSTFRGNMLKSPEIAKLVLDRHYKYYADPDIPKDLKFLENEKLLRKLVELGTLNGDALAAQVNKNIVDRLECERVLKAYGAPTSEDSSEKKEEAKE